MLITLALLILGFILLVKSADFFVKGSAALALKLSVSEIVIGLTVVAFGTSAPELLINLIASVNKNSGITFGNIVGSNIFNILLILGISGTINAIATKKNTVWREIPFSLLAALVLLVICNDLYLDGSQSFISRSDGIILLLFFIIFLTYVFLISKIEIQDETGINVVSNSRIIIYILFGLIGLIIGAKLVVNNAVEIARIWGVSENLIGLTIVAAGTSLPELATSVVAASKKKSDIAIGNIIGSNIFNAFFILGISSIVNPIKIMVQSNIDLLILIVASSLLFFTMFTGKKRTLDRWEAVIFLILYFLYLIFLIYRG